MHGERSSSKRLKHAIILPNWEVGGDTRLMVEYGVAAEEASWDGLLLADHLAFPPWGSVTPGPSPRPDDFDFLDFVDPWISLAGIAARTEHITLGSWVTPVPRRQPCQFARDLATLDRLSQGRVLLGAGLGRRSEYEPFGDEWNPRALGRRYDEALEIIDGLWRGERVTYQGEFHTVDDVAVLPTPVQRPRIPIIIGGLWPYRKPFQRGARWDGIMPHFPGDGVLPAEGDDTPEEIVREMLAYYHSLTDDPGEIMLLANPPGSTPDYPHICEELGVTWLCTRTVDAAGQWRLDLEQIQQGPPE